MPYLFMGNFCDASDVDGGITFVSTAPNPSLTRIQSPASRHLIHSGEGNHDCLQSPNPAAVFQDRNVQGVVLY